MPSPPLDSTHGRMTLGVYCHHLLWAAHTVELRRAWQAIIAFGQHKRSNDVERGIPSSPLGSTHGRTTSGVACQHRLKAAHIVERNRAWHDITAFGQHTRSNDVRCDIPSPPLDSTHGQTTSGVRCHHRLWTSHTFSNVGRGMTSPLLDSTHGRMTSDMACHHRPWAVHTVALRRAWHVTTSFGQHTRSNYVGCGKP